MESILRIALSNAALAAVAALLAWVAGRLLKRPALTHALWLIVLLKLVTPPLWTVTLPSPRAGHLPPGGQRYFQPQALPEARPLGREREILASVAPPEVDAAQENGEAELAAAPPLPLFATTAASPSVDSPPIASGQPPLWPSAWRKRLVSWAMAIWAAGALGCLLVGAIRILAFGRLLRFAVPAAREVQDRADLLSRRLGLDASPEVAIVPGCVCPMLWAAGLRPRVLVPERLWRRLGASQRDTLLLHELAHLRRRDHWVRWLELIVTALYWWNPVCWWARHELREAEEQCCDAWVLWAMPGSFRDYASALLEAVDFVSVRSSVPVLASGMGQFDHMRRRLIMLKQGDVARALTWTGLAAACGAGAILLSVAPTLAQSVEEKPPKAETITAPVPTITLITTDREQKLEATAPAAEEKAGINAEVTSAAPNPAAIPAPPDAPAPAQPPSAGLGGNPTPAFPPSTPRRTIRGPQPGQPSRDTEFRFEMNNFQPANRLDQLPGGASLNSELARSRQEVAELSRQLKQAAERLKQLEMMRAKINVEQFDVDVRDGRVTRIMPKVKDATAAAAEAQNAEAQKLYADQARAGARFRATRDTDDRDRRLQAVERQLSELLREVKQLHEERGAGPSVR